MKEAISKRALELGFDDCRFTSAQPPESGSHLQSWLSRGWHGHMAYMERNARKRQDPQAVLPGSRSIITLAVSYAPAETLNSTTTPPAFVQSSKFKVQGSTVSGRILHPEIRVPREAPSDPCRQSPSSAQRGLIARYARYRDYHDVLGAKLKTLAEFVDRLGDPGTRSLWDLDTGPIFERYLPPRPGLPFA